MGRSIMLFIIIALAGTPVMADHVQDSLISQANKAYTEGAYEVAAGLYKQILDQGYTSAELHYNLGNAFFKSGDIPSAILHYEKARKLDPRNDDIHHNLSLANSRIIDKIEPVPEFFLKKWWKQVLHLMGPEAWSWTIIVLFIIVLIAAAVFLASRSVAVRKMVFWVGVVILALTILSTITGIQSHRELKAAREGVIFTPTVTVKSSPAENSVDLFVIHEGTKVQVLDRVEGWSEIRILNGSVGWVKNSDYRSI